MRKIANVGDDRWERAKRELREIMERTPHLNNPSVPCPVVHPTFGRCIVTGPHGDADRPHRYAAPARCQSYYDGATLAGSRIRCELEEGHAERHGHSFAARYWD